MAELVVGTSPRAVRLLEPTLPRESPRVTPLQNEGRERGFRKRPPRGGGTSSGGAVRPGLVIEIVRSRTGRDEGFRQS